jgi:hypothetical protein
MKVTSKKLGKTTFYGLETQGGAFMGVYFLKPVFEGRSIIAYQLIRTKNSRFSKIGPQHTIHFLLKGRVDAQLYRYKNVSAATGDVLEPAMFNTTSSARRRIYYLAVQSIKSICRQIDFSGDYDVEVASTMYEFNSVLEANKRLREGDSIGGYLRTDLKRMGLSTPRLSDSPNYPKVGDFLVPYSRWNFSHFLMVVSVDEASDTIKVLPTKPELLNPEDRDDFSWEAVFKPTSEKSRPSSREITLFVKEDGGGLRIKGSLGDKSRYFQMLKGQVKLDGRGNYVTQMKGYLDVSNEW